MKKIALAITAILSISVNAEVVNLSGSDNIAKDASQCLVSGCSTVFGTITTEISDTDHNKLKNKKITLELEQCKLTFWSGRVFESTDEFERKYIRIFANESTGAHIQCGNDTIQYPRIALMDSSHQFGVILYENNDVYRPFGDLIAGIMLLPERKASKTSHYSNELDFTSPAHF